MDRSLGSVDFLKITGSTYHVILLPTGLILALPFRQDHPARRYSLAPASRRALALIETRRKKDVEGVEDAVLSGSKDDAEPCKMAVTEREREH